MEIIKRSESLARGLNSYFTGEPCKRGHITYRYVKNGACSDCVKSANGGQVTPESLARKEVKERMVALKVRGYMEDRDTLAAAAYGLALMRAPVLLQSDVDPKILPKGAERSGSMLFTFLCFQEDVDALRQIANGMKRPFDVEAARVAAFKEAAKWS